MDKVFNQRLQALQDVYHDLIERRNEKEELGNGVYDRYVNPVLTAQHAPVFLEV